MTTYFRFKISQDLPLGVLLPVQENSWYKCHLKLENIKYFLNEGLKHLNQRGKVLKLQ